MALPPQVHTALHRGLELAAEVSCSRSGWRAWVWISPVMKSGKTYHQVLGEWTLNGVASRYDDTIARFKVRYAELSDWHLDERWFFDLDIAIKERPIVDTMLEAEDEEALIEALSRWLTDLSQLKAPSLVDYPWPPMIAES